MFEIPMHFRASSRGQFLTNSKEFIFRPKYVRVKLVESDENALNPGIYLDDRKEAVNFEARPIWLKGFDDYESRSLDDATDKGNAKQSNLLTTLDWNRDVDIHVTLYSNKIRLGWIVMSKYVHNCSNWARIIQPTKTLMFNKLYLNYDSKNTFLRLQGILNTSTLSRHLSKRSQLKFDRKINITFKF